MGEACIMWHFNLHTWNYSYTQMLISLLLTVELVCLPTFPGLPTKLGPIKQAEIAWAFKMDTADNRHYAQWSCRYNGSGLIYVPPQRQHWLKLAQVQMRWMSPLSVCSSNSTSFHSHVVGTFAISPDAITLAMVTISHTYTHTHLLMQLGHMPWESWWHDIIILAVALRFNLIWAHTLLQNDWLEIMSLTVPVLVDVRGYIGISWQY